MIMLIVYLSVYYNVLFYIGCTHNTLRSFLVVFVAIKLQAIEETSGISWRIMNTNCKSDTNLKVSANRVYNKDCELSLGLSYTLQCEARMVQLVRNRAVLPLDRRYMVGHKWWLLP